MKLIRKDTCASYEPAIGETLQYEFGLNRVTVVAVADDGDGDACDGCVFKECCNVSLYADLCDSLRCSYRTRTDNKNIIFKIVY